MARKNQNIAEGTQQILDAANKVVNEFGSENINIVNIAKKMSTSEAAVYPNFRGKKDILSLLIDHFGDSLVEGIKRASADSNDSPLRVLENALRNHLSAIEEGQDVSFQVVSEIVSLGDKELNAKMVDAINEYKRRIESLLIQGIKSSEIREDLDTETAAVLLFGLMEGLVDFWVLSNRSFDLKERFKPLWHLFSKATSS